MGKNFRKRLSAFMLALLLAVTTLGSVTTVSADSTSGGSLIDFSIPFDFLFFHFGNDADEMTEEDLEAERDRLREQSMKAEKAAGLKLVYEYTMETPEALSSLDLSGCKGEGTFRFANPEFVPEKGVTVCEFIFTPDNVKKYDYDLMLGWDEDTQTLRRYAEVVCSSLAALEEEVTDEPQEEDSVIPDAVVTTPGEENPEGTPTPDVTEAPEGTGTPEGTPTPDVTGTPETTPTPDVTGVPEETGTPEETQTPDVTEAPESTETPEATPTPDATETPKETGTPEATPDTTVSDENVSKPGNNLIPEITTIPGAVTPTPVPEATPTPAPVVTAPINPGSSAENGVQIIEKDDTVKAFESQVLAFEEGEMTAERMASLISLTNAYEALTEEQKNAVASDVMNKLSSLQDTAAEVNHTSNGVTVSGNVPWYVQLKVTVGNDTDTYEPTGLETIVPYEMCLWNIITDSEYKLAGGEKVTLTMAVPENIHLYDGLTIVHYMDETHYEYIELKITGETMSFETASFSPFNVAGSTILVGGKPSGSSTSSNNSSSNTGTTSSTTKPSSSQSSSSSSTSQSSSSSSKTNTSSSNSGSTVKPVTNTSSNTVKTGDNANISRYIMIGLGAAVLVVLCVMLVVRSKKDNE